MRQATASHRHQLEGYPYILAAAGLSLIAAAGIALSGGPGARAQSSLTVDVGDFWFCDAGDSACMIPDLNDIDVVTTINVGDTVVWAYNTGIEPHTTTECGTPGICGVLSLTSDPASLWESGFMAPAVGPAETGSECGNETDDDSDFIPDDGCLLSFSRTFNTPGEFQYHCRIHPTLMRGVVTVLAAAEPASTLSPTPTASPAPPSPTPTPADLQPVDVPAGGGAPPAAGGISTGWWLAMAAGGVLLASAAVLVLGGLRRQ